ncbi:General stress protein 26 [Planococcus glaciei]|uniref:pyridoxamine 5'-phosphate oxidase family protein n=1 Tax=Planococcus glaciei TaxID=459472 RepID=UPI00087EF286|nr:pyridoxamine 5'-phosphate oxidase family protein [Planococcus glaciei]SDH36102.1 General stress protein 26 [Planococcus glaciei]
MANHTTSNQEAIEKVKELIKDIEVAMFTTISNGKAVSRPMQTQETEFDGDLWFMTMKDTSKYQEILENPSVNLAYSGKSYVSISGTAEFSEDLEKKKEYWNPVFGKLLETTYDDPNVVLIKVTPETAEYWESGTTLKTVKKFAKKLTTKETMGEDDELNDTVEFERHYGSDS